MKIALVNVVCTGSTGKICRGIQNLVKTGGGSARIFYGRGSAPKGTEAVRIASPASVAAHALLARATDRMGLFSKRDTLRLIQALKAYDPDVIHLHNLHGYYLNVELLFQYLKTTGKPVVWTLHDCWAFTGHCAFFHYAGCDQWKTGCSHCPQRDIYPARWLVDHSPENYRRKRAAFTGVPRMTLAAPSRWLTERAEESFLSGYPSVTVANGVDQAVFRPTESAIRGRYGIGEEKLVLGVANVWDVRKGLDTFLALAGRMPPCRFALIGLNEKQIRTLPPGIIGIARTESARELAAWYTAADVLVNPTRADNFPTTHIEALSCGTPVVTFDVGGCREAFDDSCGVAVPPEDLDGLARGVERAFAMKREDCLEWARRFDERTCFAAYGALYERLLEEARP